MSSGNIKKTIFLVLVLIITAFSISAVSASSYNSSVDMVAIDDSNYQNEVSSVSVNDKNSLLFKDVSSVSVNDNDSLVSQEDISPASQSNSSNNVDVNLNIQEMINNAKDGDILILSNDYIPIDNPIVINKQITIDGKNSTFDGKSLSQLLIIQADNVIVKNLNFINLKCFPNQSQKTYLLLPFQHLKEIHLEYYQTQFWLKQQIVCTMVGHILDSTVTVLLLQHKIHLLVKMKKMDGEFSKIKRSK